MQNEERILSMLDLIASEVKDLKDTSIKQDEFRSFKEQTYDRFNRIEENMMTIEENMVTIEENMVTIEENMVTKDDFLQFKSENREAHESTKAIIAEQSKVFNARFDVLNGRLFDQETQLKILRTQDVL